MANYSIWFGRLLILVGIIGYAYGMATGHGSLTALIPAAFGLIIMILGHVAARSASPKTAMHIAILFGLLGFILPAIRLVSKASELTMSVAVLSQVAMAVICLLFVILGIRSFVAARRETV
jgi:hypothetical protein